MRIDRVECRRILEKAYRCEDLTPKQLSIVVLNPIDSCETHDSGCCCDGKIMEEVPESGRPNWCPLKESAADCGGWIPCKERLPEEKINPMTKDFCEYQVTFKSEDATDIRHYKFGRGHWWNGPGIMDEYVIAWRKNLEPYHEP